MRYVVKKTSPVAMFPNVAYISASDNKRIIFRIPNKVSVGDKFVVHGRGEGGFRILFPDFVKLDSFFNRVRSIDSAKPHDIVELYADTNEVYLSFVTKILGDVDVTIGDGHF